MVTGIMIMVTFEDGGFWLGRDIAETSKLAENALYLVLASDYKGIKIYQAEQ